MTRSLNLDTAESYLGQTSNNGDVNALLDGTHPAPWSVRLIPPQAFSSLKLAGFAVTTTRRLCFWAQLRSLGRILVITQELVEFESTVPGFTDKPQDKPILEPQTIHAANRPDYVPRDARRGEELAQSFARNPNLNQAKSPADGLDKPEPFQMKVQRPHALVLYPDQRMEIPFQGCNS